MLMMTLSHYHALHILSTHYTIELPMLIISARASEEVTISFLPFSRQSDEPSVSTSSRHIINLLSNTRTLAPPGAATLLFLTRVLAGSIILLRHCARPSTPRVEGGEMERWCMRSA